MCILFIAVRQHQEYPLIILANRDEFQERPTQFANYWEEYPNLLAGKDKKEGGTWLGVTKQGRISALTNYRDIPLHKEGRASRGHLVRDFLTSEEPTDAYLETLRKSKENYNPYNILIGNKEELYVYNNVSNETSNLSNGFFGLSNAYLNSPWPKVSLGIENLKNAILENKISESELFKIMKDETKAPDSLLPNTGVGLEKERFLSSIFIRSEVYGTRSTALLFFNRKNQIKFFERTYDPKGETINEFQTEISS